VSLAPIEYADASPRVRTVYDDIMATRKTDWINSFWKVLAHDPLANETDRLAVGYDVPVDPQFL
jgi:hypothetical protein